MNYILKNFTAEVNDNIFYLKCECFSKNKFISIIETNKAFDLSQNISTIKLKYTNSKLIKKENIDYSNNNNYIYLPIPDNAHYIAIPFIGTQNYITNKLIRNIYNEIDFCIDYIDSIFFSNEENISKEDLDYVKSRLDAIQSTILKKYTKGDNTMKLHEVEYPDGSKFTVNSDKKGNVYMNVYTGDVRDKNNHSHEGYQISGDLKDGNAYKGGHGYRNK